MQSFGAMVTGILVSVRSSVNLSTVVNCIFAYFLIKPFFERMHSLKFVSKRKPS